MPEEPRKFGIGGRGTRDAWNDRCLRGVFPAVDDAWLLPLPLGSSGIQEAEDVVLVAEWRWRRFCCEDIFLSSFPAFE